MSSHVYKDEASRAQIQNTESESEPKQRQDIFHSQISAALPQLKPPEKHPTTLESYVRQ